MSTKTRNPSPRPLLRLTEPDLHDLDAATAREWLETDGRGGYASSTVVACPTRRYHGWLVAPVPDGGERHVFLTRFDERLLTPDGDHPFACARWPGTVAPRGDRLQTAFELAPFPTFVYAIGGLSVRREILVPKGRHAVLVRYSLSGGGNAGVELQLRPLLACRSAHALTFANPQLDETLHRLTDGMRCQPYPGLPGVTITWSAGWLEMDAEPVWYRRAEYAVEAARGFDAHEDNWSPCRLRFALREGAPLVLAASIEGPIDDPAQAFAAEEKRRRPTLVAVREPRDRVALAADDFLFRTAGGRLTVCAGYPWFGEWGRDTFIALPGLTLARGQLDVCTEVLSGAVAFLHRGLLPNVWGPTPESSSYASADAALWFARAVWAWADAGGKRERLHEEYLPALVQIADAYASGETGLGLGLTEDGLLRAGSPDTNPTWMDACTADGPVTPRDGCAVELNALWYQLVVRLADACRAWRKKDLSRRYDELAKRCKRSFVARFWLAPGGYLADRIGPEGVVDASVRPNMVIAAALAESPLSKTQRRAVVDRARAELLTPRGLRTLSPSAPGYIGRYEGGPRARDSAYHQGTVWPWLLGFFVEASLRAQSPTKKLCAELRALLQQCEAELDNAGLHHVSEVFDGDPPHRPGGTIAQAWNTAEWLRSLRLLDAVEGVRS